MAKRSTPVNDSEEIEQAVFNARILLILDGIKAGQEDNTKRIDRLESAAIKVLTVFVLNLLALVGTLAAMVLKIK